MFLRLVLVIIALLVGALCVSLWTTHTRDGRIALDSEVRLLRYPFIAYFYGGAIPFYLALVQAFKLLNIIDANKVFSNLAVKALRNIKYCAVAIIGYIGLGAAYIALLRDGDRAGVMALCIYTMFVTLVIATFAGLLQRILQNAIAIKKENDLTV